MRVLAFVMLLAATMVADASPRLLEHVPLVWKPTSELRPFTMEIRDVPIQVETFQDGRAHKDEIGVNHEDDKPKPVTTTDNVGAFVSRHIRELFGQAGFKTVDSGGAVTIKGEVRQFFVTETNTYNSQLTVHLSVVGRDGTTRWTGLATGRATRFGRSYKLENYYEGLSDAIVDAVNSMLRTTDFQKALSAN